MKTNGFAFGISDAVTLGSAFPYPSSYIYVATGGDIVYMNASGQLQFFPGAGSGVFLPIAASKIVASGTVNGNARSTTASGLVYCCSVPAV